MCIKRTVLCLVLLAVAALPSLSAAIQLTTVQKQARQVAFQQLEEKARATGKPVSVIVRFDDQGIFRPGEFPVSQRLRAAQDAFLAKLGDKVTKVKRFESFPFLAYTVTSPGLSVLRDDPGILSVQEDKQRKPLLIHSVPWIGAPLAWDAGFSGSGQYVAVIDTGVDSSHPFLADKVEMEACFSFEYMDGGYESLCPNGTDYQLGPGAAQPCSEDCAHGTHVAGIAAGKSASFSGVAKDAKIIAVQVFTKVWDTEECGEESVPCLFAFDSNQILALDYVYKLKALTAIPVAAVNMSLGGDRFYSECDHVYPLYADAVEWLKLAGVATIAAAGNESYVDSITFPACLSRAISVGSICDTTEDVQCPQGPDSVAEHSNIAPFVSLVAPGAWITSSVPGGGYRQWAGTSMAAPHVAGAWAVMKEHNPLATVDDVLQDLQDNAFTISDTRPGGTVTNLKSLDLTFLENAPSLVDNSIMVSLEDPPANAVVTGVGSIRGWAIGPEGIAYVQFYVDGVLKKRIPYGGSRNDVGNANPGIPNSASSGFSQSFNYAAQPAGTHTITIRAVSRTGKYKEVSNTFTTTGFHKAYFPNAADVDISNSSVSQDGTGVLLNNVRVEGQPYDVRLEWQVPTQQFGIIDVQ